MWVKVTDYKDYDCVGCTCCYVTTDDPEPITPLCDECEYQSEHPDYQIECHPVNCNYTGKPTNVPSHLSVMLGSPHDDREPS